MLHHLEIWVEDLAASNASVGWLLDRLGYEVQSTWASGISYAQGDFYIVLESGPDVSSQRHNRVAPGMNHMAFSVPGTAEMDQVTEEAQAHGFTLMFADRHPHAGGAGHYAAYLEDAAGFEIELVAQP